MREADQGFWAYIWEQLWIPLLLAIVAAFVTWLVWYNTVESCAETISLVCRSATGWGRYIDVNLFNKMLIHGALLGGAGGIYRDIMLRRERQRAIDAERQLAEERRQLAEERRLLAEERRQLAEERKARQEAERREREASSS